MGRKRRSRQPDRLPGTAGASRARGARRRDRTVVYASLAVLLGLAAIGDDRHVGLVADGRQMIRTAVAIAETGDIGQARGRDFTLRRDGGDAVSRFGMATSLLQVPAAWMAPRVEESFGPGSSQALFLLVPWLAVGAAAAAAGVMARRLGGNNLQVASAVWLASMASPLASYAMLEFSEPVQAAALVIALTAALASAQARDDARAWPAVAGFAAGFAVLTKSSLMLAAPATLLPLVDPAAPRRSVTALARAACGAAGPLALWAAFEFVRFGLVFGGYPDDRFTHPWFDGLWRLLVGPNRGLLLFWPALILFVLAALRWRGAWISTPAARAWLGATIVLVAQLAVAAGYWGWHGMEGWGPRLIVPAVPLLAAFAAVAPVPRAVLAAVVVLCTVLNLPPVMQHPTPVATYVMNLPWPEVPESDVWRYPFYATGRSPGGKPTVVPFAVLEMSAAANPWRVYLWFRRVSGMEDRDLAAALRDPPWAGTLPHIVPAVNWPADVARQVAPPPRPGFLGRSLTGTGGPYATVYLDALLDQVVRANQQNRIDRALELSAARLRLREDGEAAAWRLETLRRAGRAQEAETVLRSLSTSTRSHPLINVVLALFDRDAGEERRARALLTSVAEHFRETPVTTALGARLEEWPPALDAMTEAPRRDATVAESR